MIVVTTPTGNIGSKLLTHLLESNESVRVIVRDASRLPAEIRGRVEIVEGSHGDAAAVNEAFQGAESRLLALATQPKNAQPRSRLPRFRASRLRSLPHAWRSARRRRLESRSRYPVAKPRRHRHHLFPVLRPHCLFGGPPARPRAARVHGQPPPSGCIAEGPGHVLLSDSWRKTPSHLFHRRHRPGRRAAAPRPHVDRRQRLSSTGSRRSFDERDGRHPDRRSRQTHPLPTDFLRGPPCPVSRTRRV